MADSKLQFTRASDGALTQALQSMILEATYEGQEIADILCEAGQWRVWLMSEAGIIKVPWEQFVEIFQRFSQFVDEENLAMLREAQAEAAAEIDRLKQRIAELEQTKTPAAS